MVYVHYRSINHALIKMIPLKSYEDIEVMCRAGQVLAEVMKELEKVIRAGVRTIELDQAAESLIEKSKAIPAFKGYRGYPACLCVSVNEEVVHGIPGERVLREGDIVGLDLGIQKDGFFVDMARTFCVGVVDLEKRGLVNVTRAALDEAMAVLKPGNTFYQLSGVIQDYVESKGLSVVRDFVGHGIGRSLHEEPQIPNFRSTTDTGETLQNGMVVAIEPMVNAGGWEVEVLSDGWTAVTKDRRPSAHFEDTVAIWDDKVNILTQ